MIRKLLWFTVGMGVGVVVYLRVRTYVRTRMPQAVSDSVSRTGERVRTGVLDFADRAREAMAEREQELRDTLGLTADQSPGDGAPGPSAARGSTAPHHSR